MTPMPIIALVGSARCNAAAYLSAAVHFPKAARTIPALGAVLLISGIIKAKGKACSYTGGVCFEKEMRHNYNMSSASRKKSASRSNPDALPETPSLGALPSRLSPSRAKDFMQCPKLFYFKTILKLETPGTEATYKGTLAHYAFEHIFDHPRGERTPQKALPYVRAAWNMLTNPLLDKDAVPAGTPEFSLRESNGMWRHLHEPGSKSEAKLLKTAQEMKSLIKNPEAFLSLTESVVESWFKMENPNKFDPLGREYHLEATIKDVTLHGFIDRLDKIEMPDGSFRFYISDYKTGSPPKPRYEEDAFFQLDIYAALLKETLGVIPYELRLIYVREGKPDAILRRRVDQHRIDKVIGKSSAVWSSILRCAKEESWPTRKQILCDWCFFKPVCPAWEPELDGILAEEIALRTGASKS